MKKETKKLVAGAMVGTVVGGTLGVLFAPRKGSDTRVKIKDTFIDLKDKVANLSNEDIQKYINKKLDEIDKEINMLEVTNSYKEAKRRGKKLIKKINKLTNYCAKKGKDEFSDLIEELKSRVEDISEEILTSLDK